MLLKGGKESARRHLRAGNILINIPYFVCFFKKCTGSASTGDKCSDTYRGPYPFSEVEMRNIRDYLLTLDPVPILATSVHSYGQLYLWPYGYDYNEYPDNYKEIVSLSLNFKSLIEILIVMMYIFFLQRDLAEEAVSALKSVHGTVFVAKNSAELCKMFIFFLH